RLDQTISLRLTTSDFAVWNAKVLESGLTASEFFRNAVIQNRTTVRASNAPTQDKKQLDFLVSKISNNINQLARRANEDNLKGILSQSTYRRLLETLLKIMNILKDEVSDAH